MGRVPVHTGLVMRIQSYAQYILQATCFICPIFHARVCSRMSKSDCMAQCSEGRSCCQTALFDTVLSLYPPPYSHLIGKLHHVPRRHRSTIRVFSRRL